MTRQWKNRIALISGCLLGGIIFIFLDPDFMTEAMLFTGLTAVLVRDDIL